MNKDLASRHGGRILVGDTPGGGATFEVVFAGG
jgi:signal transduction histidine kinase